MVTTALPRNDRPRADYACDPQKSRGRLLFEPASATRSEFQRDRDRIIHSSAFRRLKHKTQVFVYHEGDHYRTRLTHTLEVAQIARSLARTLELDEDLAEALALAHDLGHTPFGHAGEDALNFCMQPYGGFDHNAQALRIVTSLERRYAGFDGLNLTWETLEGLVKHNGPLMDKQGNGIGAYKNKAIPEDFIICNRAQSLELDQFASAEAQIAAIADDIAYNTHDIDDGLRAGLFSLSDLKSIPIIASILDDIVRQWPHLDKSRTIHELGRRLITWMIEDVLKWSLPKLCILKSSEDVRLLGHRCIDFSEEGQAADHDLKQFLMPHMYRHKDVLRIRLEAEALVHDLFTCFMKNPQFLPDEWLQRVIKLEENKKAREISDYIAGMTDRFAILEHQRLFDVTPELR
jgi:dGTPase